MGVLDRYNRDKAVDREFIIKEVENNPLNNALVWLILIKHIRNEKRSPFTFDDLKSFVYEVDRSWETKLSVADIVRGNSTENLLSDPYSSPFLSRVCFNYPPDYFSSIESSSKILSEGEFNGKVIDFRLYKMFNEFLSLFNDSFEGSLPSILSDIRLLFWGGHLNIVRSYDENGIIPSKNIAVAVNYGSIEVLQKIMSIYTNFINIVLLESDSLILPLRGNSRRHASFRDYVARRT